MDYHLHVLCLFRTLLSDVHCPELKTLSLHLEHALLLLSELLLRNLSCFNLSALELFGNLLPALLWDLAEQHILSRV